MSISRKLREEIEAVTPPDDRPRPILRRAAVALEDTEVVAVPAPTIDPRYGRFNGVTVRDRVLAMLREHQVMPQREIFARVWRAIGSEELSSCSVRGQVSKALEQLEDHDHVRRTKPPRDVEPERAGEVWWEVLS